MHIRQEDYEHFQDNTIHTDDMIAFLEHLEECDFCLNEFIREEETHAINTPAYLKEQILNRAASPNIQMAKTAAETSAKMQMLYHSLQTAAGVILALLLLFSIGKMDFSSIQIQSNISEFMTTEKDYSPPKNHLMEFTRSIGEGLTGSTQIFSDYLNDFSNKISHGGTTK